MVHAGGREYGAVQAWPTKLSCDEDTKLRTD